MTNHDISSLSPAKTNWLLFGIILAALALRLLYFSGFQGADDASLAHVAIRILNEGFYIPQEHYSARIGITVPLSMLFRTLGIGEWQIAGLALAFDLLGIWLAYAIGKETAGPQTGILAALLLAVFPLDIYYGSTLYPDMPLGVILALSYYLMLRGLKAERPFWWLAGAGLAWGYAYLIKIEAVFMGAVFLVMIWQYRDTSWRRVLVIILALAAVVLVENLSYLVGSGEILHRVKVISGAGIKARPAFTESQLWVYPKAWFVTFYEFGLYYYLLFAALLWALWKRQKALLLLSSWVIIYLIWLEFGGNPFSAHYAIKSHLLRYPGMISIPMAVLCAFFLLHAFQSVAIRRSIIALLVLSSLFFANFNSLGQERIFATKQAMHHAIDNGLFPLYTDHTSGAIGDFMVMDTPYEGQVHRIQKHHFKDAKTDITPLEGLSGYLLLVRDSMEYTHNRYYMKSLDIHKLQETHATVYVLNNPMNWLAYQQARLLVVMVDAIPSKFLRDKIVRTGNNLLRDRDAIILKLKRKTVSE